ncbi:hypothetical protein XBFFL1_320014 [Xenorhabdus bovienii str. feltiae Florida]|nr:hypothetical protein XBFFL1_320014 [Xenorhabdus bovienii str. feltiae Florida]
MSIIIDKLSGKPAPKSNIEYFGADFKIDNCNEAYALLVVKRRIHIRMITSTVSGKPWNIRITTEGGSQT